MSAVQEKKHKHRGVAITELHDTVEELRQRPLTEADRHILAQRVKDAIKAGSSVKNVTRVTESLLAQDEPQEDPSQ